jgi:hypothetical protein
MFCRYSSGKQRYGELPMSLLPENHDQHRHHRGQINTRLRELGNEPPLVDFIA